MCTSKKKVLVSGVTGQDGPYLCRHLLDEGYEVYGMIRRASTPHFQGLKYLGIQDDVIIVECELTEYEDVRQTIEHIMPDEVYNLAAQSHVGSSFKQPVYTSNVNYLGVLHILEAIRGLNMIEKIKFYQASTSEMFGGISPPEGGYDEKSIFHPRSPYGVSKLGAHWLVQNYREAYGLFGCCGILFNHESQLRGMNFVTRKVTHGLARLALGKTKIPLEIGNILATRDWGHAEDYTRAMYLMLQQDKPDNYVVATGEASSVAHLVNVAAYYCGIQGKWEGDGVDAQYIDEHGVLVKINPEFYRPAEVSNLIGNHSKAKKILQWEPEYCFEDMIRDMVHHDMDLLHSEVRGSVMRSTLNNGQATMAELIKKVNNGKIQDTLEA